MSKFSKDFPFEEISDMPSMDAEGVKALDKFIGRYPSSAPATLGGFGTFCQLLMDVRAPWRNLLETFVGKMNEGVYEDEFGKFANMSETGHIAPGVVSVFGVYECSQVSSLFSLFCQALHYNDFLDDEDDNASDALEGDHA